MDKISALNAKDLEELQPVYIVVPTAWRPLGVREVQGKKNGKTFMLVEYMMTAKDEKGFDYETCKVGFFTDQMGKNDDGFFMVQEGHFKTQVERARAYNDAGKGKV